MTEDTPLTVEDLTEYCRVQAGLLAGHVERMGEEATTLLDEVDGEIEAARAELDAEGATETATPPSTDGPSGTGGAAPALADVEEKQALVEAKQTRMDAFSALAEAYSDLAADLGDESPETALERVVAFEVEHDAPTYFDDRETLAETVAAANDPSEERTRD